MTDLLPYQPDTDCETHEWRSSLGEIIRFVTRTEAQQRMMPPVSIFTIRPPQAQGGRFRGARHDERLLTLPVVLPGPQTDRVELRRWARALDPLKGEGTLTVVQGPYAGRTLTCAYAAGLETFSEDYPFLGLVTLGFHAADPYWSDQVESTIDAVLTAGEASKWFPFAGTWAAQPLTLSTSDVFSTATITNTGDVDSWPVITTLGPGTDLNVKNLTTGLEWTFTGDIADGSTLVVDTRPGHKSARLDGVNGFGRLSPTSTLWPLVPGVNNVSIGFAAATADSKVTFAWRNRWLSA